MIPQRTLWTSQDVDAPAETAWALLTDLDRWPEWGPSVRSARLDGPTFEAGATGVVTTALGPTVRFEITTYEPHTRWAWKVAGRDATDHTVTALGDDRSRVSFGVPWFAAPYLAVTRIALHRIKTLAEQREATP